MGYEFELEERLSRVVPVYRAGGFDLEVDGRCVSATLRSAGGGAHEVVVDGRREPIWIASQGDVLFLHWRGRSYRVDAINSLERATREAERAAGGEAVTAPMPGVVVEVFVEPGDRVQRGQPLLTIESMKLQTALDAPHDAEVTEIGFAAGQSFDKGAVLVRFDAVEGDGAAGSSGSRGGVAAGEADS